MDNKDNMENIENKTVELVVDNSESFASNDTTNVENKTAELMLDKSESFAMNNTYSEESDSFESIQPSSGTDTERENTTIGNEIENDTENETTIENDTENDTTIENENENNKKELYIIMNDFIPVYYTEDYQKANDYITDVIERVSACFVEGNVYVHHKNDDCVVSFIDHNSIWKTEKTIKTLSIQRVPKL